MKLGSCSVTFFSEHTAVAGMRYSDSITKSRNRKVLQAERNWISNWEDCRPLNWIWLMEYEGQTGMFSMINDESLAHGWALKRDVKTQGRYLGWAMKFYIGIDWVGHDLWMSKGHEELFFENQLKQFNEFTTVIENLTWLHCRLSSNSSNIRSNYWEKRFF